MDYDRIILEMLDRIKNLEDEVAALKNGKATVSENGGEEMKSSKKYRRLTDMLVSANGKPVSMTFSDIERTIGFPLPASAKEHRAFWAYTTTHSIALSWMCVGYKTVDVDLDKETVLFEK